MDPNAMMMHYHIPQSNSLPQHIYPTDIVPMKPATYCLFLGDLSLFCNEDDISATFSQFGQLTDVRIKRNKTTKRNLSYGFVEYLSMDHAVTAMNEMNGKVFCGRALRIRWASTLDAPKLPKARSEIGKVEDTKSVSIYLAFNSTVPNLMINDESLRVLFGAFGTIEDVSIKQSVIDRQNLCQRGYAFVCFVPNEAGIAAAVAAANQMADCLVDGVHYRCEVSKSLKGIIDPYASHSRHQQSSHLQTQFPPNYHHQQVPPIQQLQQPLSQSRSFPPATSVPTSLSLNPHHVLPTFLNNNAYPTRHQMIQHHPSLMSSLGNKQQLMPQTRSPSDPFSLASNNNNNYNNNNNNNENNNKNIIQGNTMAMVPPVPPAGYWNTSVLPPQPQPQPSLQQQPQPQLAELYAVNAASSALFSTHSSLNNNNINQNQPQSIMDHNIMQPPQYGFRF